MSWTRKKKNVMIIDDDKVRRKKLYDVLKLTGFDLSSAATSQEAMSRIPREKPTLVIVNTFSTVVYGIQFIKELRTYGAGQNMTVLGLVNDNKEERTLTTAAGADELLPEDFAPYTLVELVAKYMGIDKIEIPEEQFKKRKEVVEELAESYRSKVRQSKKGKPSPTVQLLLPDGRDLGLLQITDDAGKDRSP